MANGPNGNGLAELERRLWAAAEQLWASLNLKNANARRPREPLLISATLDLSKLALKPDECLGYERAR